MERDGKHVRFQAAHAGAIGVVTDRVFVLMALCVEDGYDRRTMHKTHITTCV